MLFLTAEQPRRLGVVKLEFFYQKAIIHTRICAFSTNTVGQIRRNHHLSAESEVIDFDTSCDIFIFYQQRDWCPALLDQIQEVLIGQRK